MVLRTIFIEMGRGYPRAIRVGLGLGSVDTDFSMSGLGNVPEGKLFTLANAAESLLNVLAQPTLEHRGKVFEWAR